MLQKIKEEIKKLGGEDDYLTHNQYPLHEDNFKYILEQVNADDVKFEIKEHPIKIDSDGYPYINFDATLEKDGETIVVEMTAYHDGEWYYYNKIK